MAQPAYNFALFEQEPKKEQKQPTASLRAVKGGKNKNLRAAAAAKYFTVLRKAGWAVVLAVFMLAQLASNARVTELTTQIQRTQKELVTAQSTNNYLNSALNERTNMAKIEETANRLGLMKLDDSQITYIRLDGESVVFHTQSNLAAWGESLYAGLLSLIHQLEY